MLDAEKWAKVKGFNAAYVSSLTRTEDFYKKCGYEKYKPDYFEGFFKKKFKNKIKI